VSWFRPHLETSLSLIERSTGGDLTASTIDVGGGASTLVDDLLDQGYRSITVLDISRSALDVAQDRLGQAAESDHWICADVRRAAFPAHSFDVWHDRAVVHFLTKPEDRIAYVQNVASVVKPGGRVIAGTFGPEGPTNCSGLDIVRYDADSLHVQFGPSFHLVESLKELLETPFGTTQQFVYCYCSLEHP